MSLALDMLPDRRVEGWRWSDLRAALREVALPEGNSGVHPIARLAPRTDLVEVGPGESLVRLVTLEDAALDAHAEAIAIAAGGALTRIVLQPASRGVALSLANVSLAEGASFRQFVLAEGGRLARIETHVEVAGAGAKVEINGIYLAGSGRHADLTSVVRHAHPGSATAQLIKGAARRGGRGVFQGKIVVARDAQKTDARQGHHALLLEEGAEIDAKPELEIYADDVACAHGNTVGGLSQEQLFYLRARGVPKTEAEALLTEAFLAEAAADWLPETVRDEVFARVRVWLGATA